MARPHSPLWHATCLLMLSLGCSMAQQATIIIPLAPVLTPAQAVMAEYTQNDPWNPLRQVVFACDVAAVDTIGALGNATRSADLTNVTAACVGGGAQIATTARGGAPNATNAISNAPSNAAANATTNATTHWNATICSQCVCAVEPLLTTTAAPVLADTNTSSIGALDPICQGALVRYTLGWANLSVLRPWAVASHCYDALQPPKEQGEQDAVAATRAFSGALMTYCPPA